MTDVSYGYPRSLHDDPLLPFDDPTTAVLIIVACALVIGRAIYLLSQEPPLAPPPERPPTLPALEPERSSFRLWRPRAERLAERAAVARAEADAVRAESEHVQALHELAELRRTTAPEAEPPSREPSISIREFMHLVDLADLDAESRERIDALLAAYLEEHRR